MHETFSFLISIVAILTAAKIFGEVAVRCGQSAIIGELIAGVVIGPAVLGFVAETEILKNIGELGAIVLLFEAGLSTDIKEFVKAGGWAALVAVAGVIFPYLFGYFIFLHFGLTNTQAIFAGAVLTATSVGITARVFMDLKKMDSQESKIVLGAAVIDDVIGLVILAVVLQLVSGASVTFGSIAKVTGVALAFLAAAVGVGLLIIPAILKFISKMKQPYIVFLAALVFCLLTAALASKAGLATIVGAFAAGLVLSNTSYKADIKREISPLYAFLVPVFFVLMGTNVDVKVFNPFVAANIPVLILTAVLFVAAFVGKALSGFVVLKKKINKLLVGTAMVPRGEVGLIFAGIGLANNVFAKTEYSALVAVVMLTTFVTPIILKYIISKDSRKNNL
ncbi:cation:proton antiporter [Endomicrobium proavitum]|uniref:NapA type Na+/H+ antiporter n=1 Tax=Endomicrobium proavitum TaxID=1408281 RepID=A0A0G3WHD2_9BACT|nr:cation:proton antiporter [Endomicrobium proavitum]AKL98036.1 NapA type Na+/H+ antiporter [Endomicrobium proavitum]